MEVFLPTPLRMTLHAAVQANTPPDTAKYAPGAQWHTAGTTALCRHISARPLGTKGRSTDFHL